MSENQTVLDNIAYPLYKHTKGGRLEYSYRGIVDSTIVEHILALAEANFTDTKEQILVRKRVYFIMVECLQNITRHQDIADDPDFDQSALFTLKRKEQSYSITSANLIYDHAIEALREKIDKINAMDADQLKEYAKQVLSNGTFSSKGGAGLGLIEMARKSGSKFQYEFIPAKYGMSMFYMNLEIPMSKTITLTRDPYRINKIREYRSLLQQCNVALIYSGTLTQGNLKNLLSILAKQINTTKLLKSRVNNLMIEMLQNILRFGDRREGDTENGCYAMFVVSEDRKFLKLTSANLIKNDNIEYTRQILDIVNNADKDQRAEMYHDDSPGKGFIAIANKSRNKYTYYFDQIDSSFSLYSLNVFLTKENEQAVAM
ncbi:MAG: SiaB family protein kinase [Bacteroidales bacterium]|nr:SiaB family protein kinase [Bacteroidales bacterium]